MLAAVQSELLIVILDLEDSEQPVELSGQQFGLSLRLSWLSG
jgi:hypothetical protein